MGVTLRAYQRKLVQDSIDAWEAGHKVVMAVSPTGSGKTQMMTQVVRLHNGQGVAMVHRGELVGQISMTLARGGIVHSIAGSATTIRQITAEHYAAFGRSFVNQASADWIVASVDTVVTGRGPWAERFKRATLGIIDEGHHCLAGNKWGKCFSMLAPDARGWLPTATPRRLDGKGLGSWNDGIADVLVEGPSMRELIDLGYLTDYTIRVINTDDLDLSKVKTTASGELSKVGVVEALAKSRIIVGNVVGKYLEFARGKLGVTFAASIEEGDRLTAEFNANGVPAAMLHGDTPAAERAAALRRFAKREIMMMVNVDLFGEGFDLPAIEIVIMARPTESFILYSQQWGRVLRLLLPPELHANWESYTPEQRKAFIAASDKPRGIIHDHVGNFMRHGGPPDMPQVWSLEPARKGAGASDDTIPVTACLSCHLPFERALKQCPHCAVAVALPPPSERTAPERVDGDIFELCPEALAKLRAGVVDVLGVARVPYHLQNTPAAARLVRLNAEKIRGHQQVMDAVALWAGQQGDVDHSVIARRFYLKFGVDVLGAAALGTKDANALRERILESLT